MSILKEDMMFNNWYVIVVKYNGEEKYISKDYYDCAVVKPNKAFTKELKNAKQFLLKEGAIQFISYDLSGDTNIDVNTAKIFRTQTIIKLFDES